MQDHGRDDDDDEVVEAPSADLSERMLRAVLDGDTYDTVAARFGITRTGVERRIKSVAARAASVVGIEGINEEGATFVRRLRLHRDAVLAALEALKDEKLGSPMLPREIRILSEDEVAVGARRIRARSHRALEDSALYYLLFATGARCSAEMTSGPMRVRRTTCFALAVRCKSHVSRDIDYATAGVVTIEYS